MSNRVFTSEEIARVLMSPTHIGVLREIVKQQRAEIERLKERIRVGFPRPLEAGEFDARYARIQDETILEMRTKIKSIIAEAKVKRDKVALLEKVDTVCDWIEHNRAIRAALAILDEEPS